jgi:membrane fusion protein (multidrug efflux system)
VEGGLKEGDQVVSAGLFQLRNGQTVKVDNSLAPGMQLAPRPGNS